MEEPPQQGSHPNQKLPPRSYPFLVMRVYLAEGKFMHAGRRSGVTIANLNTRYWKSRFIISKRIEGLELTEDNGEDLHSYPYALADSLGLDIGASSGQIRMTELGYQANFWENKLQFKTGAFVAASIEESEDFQNNTLNKDTPSNDLHLQLDFSF